VIRRFGIWAICALAACGRVGFESADADDGGSGGDPDAAAGDPTALACDVPIELMPLGQPRYWFGAGPYGVVAATKESEDAETMVITRFAQQDGTLVRAERIEVDVPSEQVQPFVTSVADGWLVGVTDNVSASTLFPLGGGLVTRGLVHAPYAVWNLATRGDHAMAAVAVDVQLKAAELDALGQDMITPVDIEMPDWEEPFVGENQNAVIVIHSHAGGTASCNVTQEYDDDHTTVVRDYGTVGPTACTQLTIARNHRVGQSMAIEGRAGGTLLSFVVPFDNTLATESLFASGELPLIAESGNHYVVTWEDGTGGLAAVGMSTSGTMLGAQRGVTANFDDGRLDNMLPTVPVLIWRDDTTLFAERLCL
jgi:hypothetical protein